MARGGFGQARRLSLVLLLLSPLVVIGDPTVALAQNSEPTTYEVAQGRYIVILRPDVATTAASTAAAFDRSAGVAVDKVYDTAFPGFAAALKPEAAARLMRDPLVLAVYPDYVVRAQAQSMEPGIDRVDADMGWAKSGDGSGVVDVDVAVIDSGVGPNDDLTIAGGHNCMGDGYLRDYYGHGTHVAGIIGARDNDFGVVGMAPGARIWSVRVLDRYGGGTWSQIICGMEWVAENAATIEVANMSLGAGMPEYGSGCTSSPAHRAVCAMTNAGVTVVAAACNANLDAGTCTPGKYPEVISVSAFAEWDGKPGGKGGCRSTPDGFYGCDDRRASFSNYGPTVDMAAIGVGVRSTLFDNRYGYWSGTSMATPHVAGGAALLLAIEPNLSPAQVRARLQRVGMSGPVQGDPDSYPEPILNVASLGEGTIEIPSSARPGDVIKLKAFELIPRTRASYRLNGRVVGEDSVNLSGGSGLTITVPDLPYGRYTVEITNHRKTLRDTVLIRPRVMLSRTSGTVGRTVTATLRGYGPEESILVSFDTGNGVRSLVRVRASSQGVASAQFAVPPSTRGSHRVTGTDSSGHSTYAHFAVAPSMSVESPVAAGDWAAITLRGFEGGETVELRWGSSTGTVLRTKVTTGSGSGELNVLIPIDSTDGKHSLWAIGNLGSQVRVTVTTFGAATDPTPTATAIASPDATATSEPTMTAVSTEGPATATPTALPPTPTATNTLPTEAPPTEMPTERPAETATAEPTAES